MKKKSIIILIFLISTILPSISQLKKGDVVDRIVAIVGEEAITESEVKGRIVFMMQQNPNMKLEDPSLFKNILNSVIDEKLIIAKAKEDSIEVSEDEVEQRWNLFLEQSIMQLGSEQRVEQLYGMSIPKMKNEFKEEIKNKLLSSKVMEVEFSRLSATNKEVEDYYNSFRDSIPEVPESISLYRIVRNVKLKNQKKEEIYKFALKIRDSILTSGKFTDFAKKYSDDKATAEEGGDLGWIQKGKFLPELEKVGFNLIVGEISLPIETPLGFHILNVREKKKDEILISHILFKLGQSDDDKERTKAFLDSLRANIKSLDEFKSAAKEISEDLDTKGFGGSLGNVPIESLTFQVAEAIKNLKDGEISETINYSTDVNNFSYQIIYKEKIIPKHKATLEDDFPVIQQQAIQNKRIQKYTEWIKKLRATMYWELVN
jgi:peptidyl-prolyl cis-trans isomerase SurA